jgi:hypothetical protein
MGVCVCNAAATTDHVGVCVRAPGGVRPGACATTLGGSYILFPERVLCFALLCFALLCRAVLGYPGDSGAEDG